MALSQYDIAKAADRLMAEGRELAELRAKCYQQSEVIGNGYELSAQMMDEKCAALAEAEAALGKMRAALRMMEEQLNEKDGAGFEYRSYSEPQEPIEAVPRPKSRPNNHPSWEALGIKPW